MRDLIPASSLDLASRADVLLARHAIILLGEQERVTNPLRTAAREATLDISATDNIFKEVRTSLMTNSA